MPRITAIGVISLGVVLHLYTGFFRGDGGFDLFKAKLLFFSCVPYFICTIIVFLKKDDIIVLFGAGFPLVLDLFMHYSVFINPTSSTAALGLLFMPIWNIVVFMPLGFLFGFCLKRFVFKKELNPYRDRDAHH